MLAAAAKQPAGHVFTKNNKLTPAIFVERTKQKKMIAKTRRSLAPNSGLQDATYSDAETEAADAAARGVEQKALKKPGVTKKANEGGKEQLQYQPLPQSLMNRHDEDMNKIAADMNEWVLREVGASLQQIEDEKKAEKSRFKPKAPAKRYQERHPQVISTQDADTPMSNTAQATDVSDEDGDEEDWVIEEYVRIPANKMASDISPSDVGFLVLEGDADNLLFFGPQNDDEDDLGEDEEDENGKPFNCR